MASPLDSPPKRSTAPPVDDRVTKRRAPRACLYCRTRKVRCDVVAGGHPCTNCRLDKLQCEVAEPNRGKRSAPAAGVSRAFSNSPPQEDFEHRRAADSPGDQATEFPVSLTFEDQMDLSHTAGGMDDDCYSASARSAAFGSSQASTGSHRQHLPRYIKPLPPHIHADDIEYLARKDALTIPEDGLRDDLLRHYFKLVHPFMPILDINDFATPILKADGSNPISLLLFQAVMFVSVSFVDAIALYSRGYSCRKLARKQFFRRVRLLYGLDCEPDRLALLQSLLLMTYWYDTPEDEKDTWYWMGISLSLAQVMGIHRDPTNSMVEPRAKRHRVRLWWSCLMRDRLLALGIRRPARVRQGDFDVPMLTLEDFNIGPLSDEVTRLLGESGGTRNSDSQRPLAVMCIELARLCICVGHILVSQYSVLANHPVSSEYLASVMVFPKDTTEQMNELVKCDEELDEWYQKLDQCCRYAPSPSNSAKDEDGPSEIMLLHQRSLHMIYLTAVGILHRPQILRGHRTGGSNQRMSRKKVRDSAIEITQMAYSMQLNNQLRYLSTSSIPAFVSAALIHLFEIRSTQEDIRNVSIGRFFQCMQVLRQLQDMYASADYAIYFLESVIQKTGIQVPMLSVPNSHPNTSHSHLRDSTYSLPSMLSATYPSRTNTIQKASPNPPGFGNQVALSKAPTALSPKAVASLPGQGGITRMLQSPGITLDETGSSNVVDQLDAGMVPVSNASQDSLQSNNWNEVDSLLCAFMHFERDAGLSASPGMYSSSLWDQSV